MVCGVCGSWCGGAMQWFCCLTLWYYVFFKFQTGIRTK